MNCTEQALVFDCAGEPLLGIVSQPAQPCDTGVVIIVGGPQYRAGSHRQFVLLARALAEGGHAALRFDYRGMGDGGGALRSFEAVSDDVAAAIAALRSAVPALRRVVLWGLCDGASAALLYLQATRNPAVAGLCLANPWVRSEASLARTHVRHYYAERLRDPAFWRKLLSGKVAWSALSGLVRSLRIALRGEQGTAEATYQQRMARAWKAFDGPILLLISGEDYTAKEFLDTAAADPAWQGALARSNVERSDLPEADHTFSYSAQRRLAEATTLAWLARNGLGQPTEAAR